MFDLFTWLLLASGLLLGAIAIVVWLFAVSAAPRTSAAPASPLAAPLSRLTPAVPTKMQALEALEVVQQRLISIRADPEKLQLSRNLAPVLMEDLSEQN